MSTETVIESASPAKKSSVSNGFKITLGLILIGSLCGGAYVWTQYNSIPAATTIAGPAKTSPSTTQKTNQPTPTSTTTSTTIGN